MSISDVWGEDALQVREKLDPFYKVLEKDDKELLKWLNQAKDSLLDQAQSRTRKQRENLMYYRGIPDLNERSRPREHQEKRLSKVRRFVVNHIFDLTETKVSQMTRIKPNVEVLPTNDEWNDRGAAKAVSHLIKHLWRINNVDYIVQNMHRFCRIFGECYLFVDWNPKKGDLHPDFVMARDEGLSEITLPDGQKVDIAKGEEVRTGDIEYDLEVPWRVLLQRKNKFEDVEYLFRIRLEKTESLKDAYPKLKNKIKTTDNLKTFEVNDLRDRFLENHTVVFEMWHKHTDEVSKGRWIKFTPEVILENTDHKFTHGKLPIIRHTDLDVPDVLNGVSKYEMIVPLQNMHNNISTLLAKNIYLMGHTKWVMPRGACRIEQLGNDNTVVQYQGPVPPQMLQVQPNPPESYQFRENIKQEMQVIYGSHGISRGEVPKGITAASALQFLNELESERATTDISKHTFMVKDIAKMSIAVAGDKYDRNDGRLVRIVGENNKYTIRSFDVANLNKDYDVRLDLSSGLPEQKSAKLQRVLDAMQRAPDMLSPERWQELLEFGDTDKLQTLVTAAVQSADSENEDILAGREVAPPERFEDHIIHWDTHVKKLQSRAIKEDANPEYRKHLEDHIKIHEKIMLDKANGNPLFQAELAKLKLFPVYYHGPAQAPASREHQEAMVQGQANRGEEVTGMIPGVEKEQEEQNGQQ
jgi:hypothetical protein